MPHQPHRSETYDRTRYIDEDTRVGEVRLERMGPKHPIPAMDPPRSKVAGQRRNQ